MQRDILIVLMGYDTPEGSVIKSQLEDYYYSSISRQQFFYNLDQLVDEEFITKATGKQENRYSLTDSGHARLQQHREWIDSHYRSMATD
jgi:DNA-binding PadR family transcriptional regulator